MPNCIGKKIPLHLLAILVYALAAHAQQKTRTPPPPPQDRQGIEQLHQKEIQASIALDIPAMTALWTEDVVLLPPEGAPIVGRDANIKFMQAAAQQVAQYDVVGYTQDWREVYELGDYAYEWGFISERFKPAVGKDEMEYHFKALRVLKRDPSGNWKIHRSAWSPVTDKTAASTPGAAATDAAPPDKTNKPDDPVKDKQ
jgi:uncharacterized protein (TIGR02246 family)